MFFGEWIDVMTSRQETSPHSIEGIQYLRGIAALMVVFFHSRSYFSEVPAWSHVGARGVDIFFVISGFIMAYTTRHAGAWPAVNDALEFLTKRIIRIVPMYWIALLWTSRAYWFHWITGPTPLFDAASLTPEMKSIFMDFLFIPHLSIDEDEQGEVFPILIQGWTLNYEMFFYLLFGVALLHARSRLLTSSAVLVVLFIIGKTFKFHDVPSLFYTSGSLIQFVIGIVIYEVYMKTRTMTISPRAVVVFLVFGSMLLFSGSKVNDKLVMGIAAGLIVWASIHAFTHLRVRSLRILGDASYAIYLFHPAAFEGVRFFLRRWIPDTAGSWSGPVIVATQVLAGTALGILLYYGVERPLLRKLRGYSDRWFASRRTRPTTAQPAPNPTTS